MTFFFSFKTIDALGFQKPRNLRGQFILSQTLSDFFQQRKSDAAVQAME